MISGAIRAAFVCVLSSIIGLAWGYENGLASSRSRCEREHGIQLPASARDFQCKGDAWGGFMDMGARALFLIDVSDLPSLLKELDIHEKNLLLADSPNAGLNSAFKSNTPTRGGFRQIWDGDAEPMGTVQCGSKRGDSLNVALWQVRHGLVAVNLHTDWN